MGHAAKCAECGGMLAEQAVTYTADQGGKLFRFDRVPARVCVQCGQIWLSARVSQLLDEILRTRPKPKRFEKVPVFSLSRLTA